MTGKARQGKINHLCRLLSEKGIDFKIEQIENMSVGQLRKKIKELGGVTSNMENSQEHRGRMIEES